MPVNAPNDNLDVLAPSFNLKNIDDEMVSLDKAKGLNGTVIVFICNHCPYVKAIASRLKKEADELLELSINTVAIMSNDTLTRNLSRGLLFSEIIGWVLILRSIDKFVILNIFKSVALLLSLPTYTNSQKGILSIC